MKRILTGLVFLCTAIVAHAQESFPINGVRDIRSGLYAFTNARNKSRVVAKPIVEFLGSDNLYLTHDNVSKLLIQNPSGLNNNSKDIIDLNELESALSSNPMVKNVEVYMSVNGEVSAEIV